MYWRVMRTRTEWVGLQAWPACYKFCPKPAVQSLECPEMSSGLTAPKCPSCKIILLRPVHHSSSSGCSAARSSSEATIMHCPACSQKYSLRKGTIIPAIVLSSATLLSGPQAKISMEATAAVSYSPDHHRGPASIASPLVNEAAALTLACCSLRSPLHVPHPPRNLRSSFTNEISRPKRGVLSATHNRDNCLALSNKVTSKPRRKLRVHRRSGSLHLNPQDLGPPSRAIGRSTSSDRISQLSNASVSHSAPRPTTHGCSGTHTSLCGLGIHYCMTSDQNIALESNKIFGI